MDWRCSLLSDPLQQVLTADVELMEAFDHARRRIRLNVRVQLLAEIDEDIVQVVANAWMHGIERDQTFGDVANGRRRWGDEIESGRER